MLHTFLWLAFAACDSQPAANADKTNNKALVDRQNGSKTAKKSLPAASHEIYNTATDKEPWLNLREGQSKDSAILAQMLDGTRVAVLEQEKWWKVQVTHGASVGVTGWAHPKWIRELAPKELTLPAKPATLAATLEKQIKMGKKKVLFHGRGTEPFWDLYVTADELLYTDVGLGIKESYRLVRTFKKGKKAQTVLYRKGENIGIVLMKKQKANDGMSERTYSYKVLWDDFHGAGEHRLIK